MKVTSVPAAFRVILGDFDREQSVSQVWGDVTFLFICMHIAVNFLWTVLPGDLVSPHSKPQSTTTVPKHCKTFHDRRTLHQRDIVVVLTSPLYLAAGLMIIPVRCFTCGKVRCKQAVIPCC